MAPPDTEALQEAPEDAMRRVAREEARAVYDELTATDADGESWSLQRLMNRFGLSRRQALKALGLIAIGYGGTQAAARALIGTAEADAIGQVGTQADPVTKAWAHAVGAGDGAAAVGFDDAVTFDHEAISSATTIGDTTYVYLDSGIASFTATIPASLEARGGYVVFIDEAANLSTNSVDIASANWTVDGVASSTFDADQAAYALRANPNQSDWTSRIFTERLDAGTIATDGMTINDVLRMPKTTVTVSSGEIAYEAPFMRVNGEGGSADTLSAITGPTTGDMAILEKGDADITLSDNSSGTDGFALDGDTDFTLDGVSDTITLLYNGARWAQIAESNNG